MMNQSIAENKKRILIANGVNLDILGQREPDVYGKKSLQDLEAYLREQGKNLSHIPAIPDYELFFFQTNCEKDFLEELSKNWDGAIINPGAWTHTSLALADRLVGLSLKFIEVHLTQLDQRDPIRKNSFCAKHALGVIHGLGFDSYLAALVALLKKM